MRCTWVNIRNLDWMMSFWMTISYAYKIHVTVVPLKKSQVGKMLKPCFSKHGAVKLKMILGWNFDKWRFSGCFVRNMWFFKLKMILGWNLDKWRFSGCFVRNMWFSQSQNEFGLKSGQMAIFRVLFQKHVVFPNSKYVWAEIWTNGDFPGASPETCGFFKLKI